MDKILHLVLSFYVVITLVDLAYAYRKYSDHKFLTFDAPTKSFWSFFVDYNKWTFLTCVALYFWIGVYKVFA